MTTKLIVLAGFLIAFAAGMVTGLQSRGPAPVPNVVSPPATTRSYEGRGSRRGGPGTSIFTRELNLTTEQQQKMSEIWSDVAARGEREMDESRRQIRQQREDEIIKLIPVDQRASYEQVFKDYSDRMTALDESYRNAYEQAVEKTKEMLTAEQRTRYEAILNRNQWDRGRGQDRGGRGRGGGPRGGRQSNDEINRRASTSATSLPGSD